MTNKFSMREWRKYKKLTEGISDVVYHYTSGLEKGAKILEQKSFIIFLPQEHRLELTRVPTHKGSSSN